MTSSSNSYLFFLDFTCNYEWTRVIFVPCVAKQIGLILTFLEISKTGFLASCKTIWAST